MAAIQPNLETIPLDFGLCKERPFDHQKVGVRFLITRQFAGLFDEMGAGKTKQAIDAAQFLHAFGIIDTVIVVCPSAVRSVWYHPELGELRKHLWDSNNSEVTEYHKREEYWIHGKQTPDSLEWIITNYDWIRDEDRLAELCQSATKRTLLILDESTYIKNHKAKQTKACKEIRKRCGYVWLLNGTPIANSPADMYSQGMMMHPSILECKNYFVFRARYATLGGFKGKQIVEWRNLDDLQRRFKPHVLRRLKEDCLDLPEKLPSVPLVATLKPATWKVYCEMRDEMIAWLDSQTIGVASQAAVKALRLAQITSGFLGGVQENPESEAHITFGDEPVLLSEEDKGRVLQWPDGTFINTTRELSTEKLDVFIQFLKDKLEQDDNFKVLVWCRFRPELERLMRAVEPLVQHRGMIYGGQKKDDRDHALRLLDPRVSPKGSAVIGGTPQTGRAGLNLTATCTVVYMSNDFSLFTRLQSEDRVHRPGQKYAVSYYDIVAVGPRGEATIDSRVSMALRNKENIASWTTAAWREAV